MTKTRRDKEIFSQSTWWDKSGDFRTLHDINPLRLALLEKSVGTIQGKKMLDWGCGGGIFTEAIAAKGAQVQGFDINEDSLKIAKEHAATNQLSINYSNDEASLPLSAFDIITCFEVLEHVEDPARLVADISTRLQKNGYVIFSTINRTLAAWLTIIVGLEMLGKTLPLGTHQFEQFITPNQLAQWCTNCGLTITDVIGLRYSFFGRHYYLDSSNTTVNYFLVARLNDSLHETSDTI